MISKIETESANKFATPIAHLGVTLCLLKGAKDPKQDWFNPYPEILRKYEDSSSDIPPHVVKTFLELSKEGKIPGWAIHSLDFT